MTQPILFTRKIEGATFTFICERTTNSRDGQPRLTVKAFESEDGAYGVPVSYIKVPGARLNSKKHLYTMPYRYEGDHKQYMDFVDEFMQAIADKLQEAK